MTDNLRQLAKYLKNNKNQAIQATVRYKEIIPQIERKFDLLSDGLSTSSDPSDFSLEFKIAVKRNRVMINLYFEPAEATC